MPIMDALSQDVVGALNEGAKDLGEVDGSASVNLAREWMTFHLLSGNSQKCPCCERETKFYPRKFEGQWVIQLRFISRHGDDGADSKEVQNCISEKLIDKSNGMRRTFTLMKHWELIEQVPEKNHHYRITELGRRFLSGEPIPAYAVLYDDEVQFLSTKTVTWRDTMDVRFDLDRLLDPETIQDADVDQFLEKLAGNGLGHKHSLKTGRVKGPSIMELLE